MNIVVIGAGALGAYFGSRLSEAGADVTFLVRERRKKQIEENHIHIKSEMGDYQIDQPKLISSASEAGHTDLVLVCVKGYHLPGVMDNLKQFAADGAYVMPILNGIEHIANLQDKLGKDTVLGGLAFIMATLDGSGHVIHSSKFHDLIFGALEPTQVDFSRELEELCAKANINATNSAKIEWELWKKYTFITAFSGITCAANLSIGEVRRYPSTLKIAEFILQEMQMLANAYHIKIDNHVIEAAKKRLLQLPKEATSSMHQDRRKGLTLEVEHLHGGAIRLAKAVGVEVPYIEAVYGLIKPFAND